MLYPFRLRTDGSAELALQSFVARAQELARALDRRPVTLVSQLEPGSQMTPLARAPVMFSAEEIKALEEVTDQPPKDFAISRLPHTKECESMPERSSFDSQRMM